MPIDLNRLDDGGLAALSSNRVGNVNLPTASLDLGAPQLGTALGLTQKQLQGYQLQKDKQAQMAQMAQVKQQGQNQLATQGLAGIQQQQLQGQQQQFDAPFKQQEQATALQGVQQQGAYQQGQLGLGQQQNQLQAQNQAAQQALGRDQLGVAQQQANTQQAAQQQEATMQQLQARMSMNEYQINKRGAAASALVVGMNSMNDPKQKEAYIQSMVPNLVQDGSMTQDEADQLLKAPPQVRQGLLMQDIMLSGAAKDGKGNGVNLPGVNMNAFGASPLDQKSQTDNQTAQINAHRSLADQQTVLTNFDPDMFKASGQLQGIYGQVAGKLPDAVQGMLPGVDAAKNRAAQIEGYKSTVLQGMMDTLAQQKGVRFNKMTLDTLNPEVPQDSDSPEQAFSKVVTLNQRMQRASQFADNLVKQGVNNNSAEYQKQMNDFVQTDSTPGKLTFTAPEGPMKGKQTELGLQQVQAFAQAHNMPFKQAMQVILANP